MKRSTYSRAQALTVSPAAVVAAVLLASVLAFAAAIVMPGTARAQQSGSPTTLGGMAGAMPVQPPFARTRSVLQAQHAASPGARTVTSGAESDKVYENYLESVGKGGAGATSVSLGSGPGTAK
ncbi:MAG: hypothetical protein PHS60_00650 [Zavarzinia sp.]|nr:hypothetical protein [Zavarzinia sp.]